MRKCLVVIVAVLLILTGLAGLLAYLEEYAKAGIRSSVKDDAVSEFIKGEHDDDDFTYEVPAGDYLAVSGEEEPDFDLLSNWIKISGYMNGNENEEYEKLHLLGVIEIPSLDIEEPIWEENSPVAMRYGVIRLNYTAGLEEEGNCVIVGHRNIVTSTIFYNLTDIKTGDVAVITTPDCTRHEYRVSSTYYCSPYDLQKYVGTSDSVPKQITLVTCAREYGNCWRFIVILVPVDD